MLVLLGDVGRVLILPLYTSAVILVDYFGKPIPAEFCFSELNAILLVICDALK